MTEHPRSFEIERIVPATEAVALQRAEPAGADLLLQPGDKKHWFRKLLLTGASLIALAGAVYFGWHYWTVGRFEISTDDAYVKADNTTIAPKVSGYLGAVLADGPGLVIFDAHYGPGTTIDSPASSLARLKDRSSTRIS